MSPAQSQNVTAMHTGNGTTIFFNPGMMLQNYTLLSPQNNHLGSVPEHSTHTKEVKSKNTYAMHCGQT